jgi:hypothetical protein
MLDQRVDLDSVDSKLSSRRTEIRAEYGGTEIPIQNRTKTTDKAR